MALGLILSENALYISGGFPVDSGDPSQHYHRGTIQALDPATGKIHWASAPEEQVKNIDFIDSLFRASPVIAGGDIFMAAKLTTNNTRDVDRLFALNKQDGKVKWTFEMWGYTLSFSDSDGVPSAPVVADDLLYIISGNEMLYAISYAD
jgi:outer membrane protein assembly factor BamB